MSRKSNRGDIKKASFSSQFVPGYLRLILAWHRVWWMKGKTGIGRLPRAIQDSTDELLSAEFAEEVLTVVDAQCQQVDGPSLASTNTEFMRNLRTWIPELDGAKDTDRLKAAECVVSFNTQSGFRDRARHKTTRKWLKLTPRI